MRSPKNRILDKSQASFDFEAVKWPEHDLFPLNLKGSNRYVETVVYKDINESTNYIIVTGFTSLSNLIDFFGSQEFDSLEKTRILIGFEPNIRGRKKYPTIKLDKEIKEYWLRKGFSIMLGGAVINLIDKINNGLVEFKYKDKLHAKLYVGDNFAILGSSNFSKNGLNSQEEANIRVNRNIKQEIEQYSAIKQIANSYYEDASNYNEKIKELLENLIQKVTWEEALARAIAEILEGEWLTEYKDILEKLQNAKLWPTQWKGLAQAVSILQSQSNVLIADPTGAGKTKLCTSLVLALKHWLYELGRNYNTDSLIICPPLVVSKWEAEFRSQKRINSSYLSMGVLSNGKESSKKKAVESLEIAKILTIDEAHNYLSPYSNRTGLIKGNQADYKILVTATPISKKIEDLLRLIDLLDIDNLNDEDFLSYVDLVNKPNRRSQDQHIQQLRKFISKFTVRRTKSALNIEIQKDPDSYKNRLNKTCKFPVQKEKTYKTKETTADKEIVRQINSLASEIKGVTHLKYFKKPNFEISQEDSLKAYIDNRINAGKALCVYQIRAALRSSHVALVEHIEGTSEAQRYFKFTGKSNHTGDKLGTINKLIQGNVIPGKHKIFKDSYFPDWLIDHEKYIDACKSDFNIYKKIGILAKKLSGERELGKAQKLLEIAKKHQHVLCFDSTVITLYYLQKLFDTRKKDIIILVASGSEQDKDSNKVMETFNLLSESNEHVIALCSDKMSESIDLQKASCVVLLDLPSVLRIVEQRIGRADRMDSLHDEIEIYWPDDSDEYALKADRRIVQTNALVNQIYGSNFNIPDVLKEKHFEKVENVKEIIGEYKDFIDKDESWNGVNDSFQPIVELKEGNNPLIDAKTYEAYRGIVSSVKTRVSFIQSDKNWCFIALRGDKKRSPKWYFIDGQDDIHTEFPDICQQLRIHISGKSEKLDWQDNILKHYIDYFKYKERELLPPKKKRALDVAEHILTKNLKRTDLDTLIKKIMRELLNMLKPNSQFAIDYERLADEWIVIFQPYLNEKRATMTRKKKILNLTCLKDDYKKIDLSIDLLNNIYNNTPIVEEIDSKIASCIIGVGNEV